MITKSTLLITGGIIILLFIVVLFFSLYVNYSISHFSSPFWRNDLEKMDKREVAMVLGARVFEDGTLSTVLEDRVQTGIDLYKAGKVKKILFSGDHGNPVYDEVKAMMDYALNQNVPIEDIFLDHAGFRTYDSFYRARDVFQVKSMYVITQKFHLNRSIYIGRKLGIDVLGVPSDKQPYLNHWMNHVREFLARVKAYMEIHIFPHPPKFLGPKVDITGDGRQSHD